jgi:hypothetical protein
MIYEWHKHFQSERTSTYDDEMMGRPSSSRNNSLIAQVKDIVCVNCQLTLWEAAEETGIFIGSCHTILIQDLKTHLVSVKFVPRLLTENSVYFNLQRSSATNKYQSTFFEKHNQR